MLKSSDAREIDCRAFEILLNPGENTVNLVFDV